MKKVITKVTSSPTDSLMGIWEVEVEFIEEGTGNTGTSKIYCMNEDQAKKYTPGFILAEE